jgi:hypothetical protein
MTELKIVASPTEPAKNVVWFYKGEFKYYGPKGWTPCNVTPVSTPTETYYTIVDEHLVNTIIKDKDTIEAITKSAELIIHYTDNTYIKYTRSADSSDIIYFLNTLYSGEATGLQYNTTTNKLTTIVNEEIQSDSTE